MTKCHTFPTPITERKQWLLLRAHKVPDALDMKHITETTQLCKAETIIMLQMGEQSQRDLSDLFKGTH